MIVSSIKHTFAYAGAQFNVHHADKNEGLPSHSHSYSHATMCNSGSCLVSLEGRSYTIDKNSQPLNLPTVCIWQKQKPVFYKAT